jgi:hypothetical protein
LSPPKRDPATLAQHRDKRCQRLRRGDYSGPHRHLGRAEHRYVLAQALSTYDHFQAQVRACDAERERRLAQWPTRTDAPAPAESKRQRNTPQIDLHTALYHILGVDVAGMPGMDPYTVLRVLSEVGTTLERFESAKAFAAWLGLCPGTRISGGKVLCGKTARVANRAARAFRLAAQAVGETDTALGAFYRRLKARLGAPKALTATAHKMARQFYALIKHGQGYVEQGAAEYEARYKQRVLNTPAARKPLASTSCPVQRKIVRGKFLQRPLQARAHYTGLRYMQTMHTLLRWTAPSTRARTPLISVSTGFRSRKGTACSMTRWPSPSKMRLPRASSASSASA